MINPLNLATLCLFLPLLAHCAEDFYKLLGIDKSATEKEIKKAYRSLSKKYHPDKNPNNETAQKRFVEVADAYEALSNSETRDIYDRYGREGYEKHKQQKQGPGGGANPFDLFSRFFGGGGHFGGGERKLQAMDVTIELPLRDFYNGIDTSFMVEKNEICDACGGSGSKDGKMDTCGTCGGRGAVIQKAQLAPGIFQQMQTQCGQCGGAGKVIKHRCKVCGGHRVVRTEERFDLSLERGMPKGYRMVYDSEGDEDPDYLAGDLVVTIMEKEPRRWQEEEYRTDGTYFRRKGHDLYWREVLSLREAWMGDWTRNVSHLDGHVVKLSRKRGQVVQPGLVEEVKNEGMPIWHGRVGEREEPSQWGSLHVEYVVVLPDQMDSGMEKEFWSVWDKWRSKKGVELDKDANRVPPKLHGMHHDEL